MELFAHSENDHGNGVPDPLRHHIQNVAAFANKFAIPFKAEDHAYLAGLLHDLGKYAEGKGQGECLLKI